MINFPPAMKAFKNYEENITRDWLFLDNTLNHSIKYGDFPQRKFTKAQKIFYRIFNNQASSGKKLEVKAKVLDVKRMKLYYKTQKTIDEVLSSLPTLSHINIQKKEINKLKKEIEQFENFLKTLQKRYELKLRKCLKRLHPFIQLPKSFILRGGSG